MLLSAALCLAVLVLGSCQDPSFTGKSIWTIGNSWQPVGSPAISSGYVAYTSVAIGPDGTPYVSFMDGGTAATAATVMKFSGASWTNVGSPGFSVNGSLSVVGVSSTKLAIDSNGRLYAAFVDTSASPNAVSVMTYTGTGTTGWQLVGSADFSGGGGVDVPDVSMAIGPGGVPYVAYVDPSTTKPTVMKYAGAAWVPVGAAGGFSTASSDNLSLAIDKAGTPYLAFSDAGGGINVMAFDGSGWQVVGSADFAVPVWYVSLALDASGVPYVGFEDTNVYRASVMKLSGGAWSYVGQQYVSAGTVYDVTIAVTPAGTPLIAFDDGSSGPATVMQLSGGSWVPLGSPGFSGGAALFTSFAVDSGGTPYAAYGDDLHWGYATVMRYR